MPEGYDESKTYPVILFLHGAGERGDDGSVPSQVGLGPAIVQRPGGVQAVVVFPQARKTWQADSDDAKAALKALEAVSAAYKVDPKRVSLTGLSMGGMGTWSLAAKHPEKFAAIAPVCGPGRTERHRQSQGSADPWIRWRRRFASPSPRYAKPDRSPPRLGRAARLHRVPRRGPQ